MNPFVDDAGQASSISSDYLTFAAESDRQAASSAKIGNASSVYAVVGDEILKRLDQGVVPWRQPWIGGLPRNLVTKRPYSGLNAIMLATGDYQSPYWLTFKQCSSLGGKVKKGERSTVVYFWKPIAKLGNDDESENDEPQKAMFFVLRRYRVFNALQCAGLEIEEAPKVHDPIAECEAIIAGYSRKPLVTWDGGQACYSPQADEIRMPDQ